MVELLKPPGFSKRTIVLLIAFLLQIIASQTSYAARFNTQKQHNHHASHAPVMIIADLLHMDGASSPFRASYITTPESALEALRTRDTARLAILKSRLRPIPANSLRGTTQDNESMEQISAAPPQLVKTDSSTHISWMHDDDTAEQNTNAELASVDPTGQSQKPKGRTDTGAFGTYYMSISMGTPRRSQAFLIDSGTQLTWVRCKPCISCKDATFDPAQSSSLTWTQCSSKYCKIRDYPSSCTSQGLCAYEQHNEGMDPTLGHLAQETFYLQNTDINDVVFGCSMDDQHTPAESAVDGVLGLGNGPFSIMSQLEGGVFYCLPPRKNLTGNPDPSGFLGFGKMELPSGAVLTQLVESPVYPDAHYLSIVGMAVNGAAVNLDNTDFVMKPSGEDGIVLDTGMAITHLAPQAYEALQAAFDGVTLNIVTTNGTGGFENCFSFPDGFQPELIPQVDFIFDRGQNLTIPPENLLIQADDTVYCFAFARSPLPVNILGTFQLSGFLVSIDPVNSSLVFAQKQCDEYAGSF